MLAGFGRVITAPLAEQSGLAGTIRSPDAASIWIHDSFMMSHNRSKRSPPQSLAGVVHD
jgi:hypothetical protein